MRPKPVPTEAPVRRGFTLEPAMNYELYALIITVMAFWLIFFGRL